MRIKRERCEALTKQNKRCKRKALPETKFCDIHSIKEIPVVKKNLFWKDPAFIISTILAIILSIYFSQPSNDLTRLTKDISKIQEIQEELLKQSKRQTPSSLSLDTNINPLIKKQINNYDDKLNEYSTVYNEVDTLYREKVLDVHSLKNTNPNNLIEEALEVEFSIESNLTSNTSFKLTPHIFGRMSNPDHNLILYYKPGKLKYLFDKLPDDSILTLRIPVNEDPKVVFADLKDGYAKMILPENSSLIGDSLKWIPSLNLIDQNEYVIILQKDFRQVLVGTQLDKTYYQTHSGQIGFNVKAYRFNLSGIRSVISGTKYTPIIGHKGTYYLEKAKIEVVNVANREMKINKLYLNFEKNITSFVETLNDNQVNTYKISAGKKVILSVTNPDVNFLKLPDNIIMANGNLEWIAPKEYIGRNQYIIMNNNKQVQIENSLDGLNIESGRVNYPGVFTVFRIKVVK